MNKKLAGWMAVVALVALVAVVATRMLGLWGGGSAAGRSPRLGSASAGSAAAVGSSQLLPGKSAKVEAAAQRLPELAHDDDPIGTIRLEGQVIDAVDQPVVGATVAIDANPTKHVTTDGSGGFVFDGLIARAYRVEATSAAGYAGPIRVQLAPTPEPLTLRLHAAGTVEVIVIDADRGTPIAGADVELRATLTYRAITDAKGCSTSVRTLRR
jgi:Carboxypeptidase regulatory-like domain